MISEKMRKKAIDLATTAIGVFLDRAGHSVAANELEAAVGGFYALAPSCPVRQTSGVAVSMPALSFLLLLGC
jgi:hypothetical protein